VNAQDSIRKRTNPSCWILKSVYAKPAPSPIAAPTTAAEPKKSCSSAGSSGVSGARITCAWVATITRPGMSASHSGGRYSIAGCANGRLGSPGTSTM